MANNIFFYSTHPDDKESAEFLKELEKNQLLKKQVILINIYQHKIPEIVRRTGKIPVLVAEGFNEFITGNAAISWLRNGGFQSKGNGYESADLNSKIESVVLIDEMKKKNDSLFINSSYNRGFDKKQSTLNTGYLSLKAESHIEIYDESDELGKLNDKVASSKLRTASSSRKNEDDDIKRSIEDDKKSKTSLPFIAPPNPIIKQQQQQQTLPFNAQQREQKYNIGSSLPFNMPSQRVNKNI